MRSNQSPPRNELEIDEISKYSILYHGPHILSILRRSFDLEKKLLIYVTVLVYLDLQSNWVRPFYVWFLFRHRNDSGLLIHFLFQLSSGLQKASQAARIPDRNCVHLLLQVFTFTEAIFPTWNNINLKINHLIKGFGYQQHLRPFLVLFHEVI